MKTVAQSINHDVAETSPSANQQPVKRRAKRLNKPKAGGDGKLRLVTLDHLDNRTLASRRVHQLIANITRDLTGDDDQSRLTEGTRQLVQRAALLAAIIESNEAQWLGGDAVDLSNYFAAINTQRRILCTLGLDRKAHDITPPSVEAYLQHLKNQKAEQREADAEEVAS